MREKMGPWHVFGRKTFRPPPPPMWNPADAPVSAGQIVLHFATTVQKAKKIFSPAGRKRIFSPLNYFLATAMTDEIL